jgi:hypothetical protein
MSGLTQSKVFWLIVILLLFAFAPAFMAGFLHELLTGLGNLFHTAQTAANNGGIIPVPWRL